MALRIAPFERFDLAGCEAWLEEMAAAGLFVTRAWFPVYSFCRGEPATVRYRLEPVRKAREPDPALLEFYADAGWEFVAVTDAFFLFQTKNSAAPEPYSDPESLRRALERLTRSMKSFAFRNLTAWLLMAVMFIAVGIRYPVRVPLLLMEIPLTGLLWVGCFTAENLWGWLRLRRLRTVLEQERIPPRKKTASRAGYHAARILLNGVVLCALAVNFLMARADGAPLGNPAIPRIAELETRYAVEGDAGVVKQKNWTAFFLSHYEVEQSGLGPEMSWEFVHEERVPAQGSARELRYSPSLKVTYFELTLPGTARLAARAQLDTYRAVNLNWTISETAYPGADFILLGAADGRVQLAAVCAGNRLAVYDYNGAESLEDHLELLIRPIQNG